MADRNEIADWFIRGARIEAKYMMVIVDMFDWNDYPVFFEGHDGAEFHANNLGAMQRIVEIYDLTLPMEEQLDRHICNVLPDLPTKSKHDSEAWS